MFITELLRIWMGNCQFFIRESPKTKGLSGKIMNNSYFSNLIKDNKILTHGFRKYCGPAGRPIGGAATDAWIFFYSSGYGWQQACVKWYNGCVLETFSQWMTDLYPGPAIRL